MKKMLFSLLSLVFLVGACNKGEASNMFVQDTVTEDIVGLMRNESNALVFYSTERFSVSEEENSFENNDSTLKVTYTSYEDYNEDMEFDNYIESLDFYYENHVESMQAQYPSIPDVDGDPTFEVTTRMEYEKTRGVVGIKIRTNILITNYDVLFNQLDTISRTSNERKSKYNINVHNYREDEYTFEHHVYVDDYGFFVIEDLDARTLSSIDVKYIIATVYMKYPK